MEFHNWNSINGNGMSLLSIGRRGIARKSNTVGLIKTQGGMIQTNRGWLNVSCAR